MKSIFTSRFSETEMQYNQKLIYCNNLTVFNILNSYEFNAGQSSFKIGGPTFGNKTTHYLYEVSLFEVGFTENIYEIKVYYFVSPGLYRLNNLEYIKVHEDFIDFQSSNFPDEFIFKSFP